VFSTGLRFLGFVQQTSRETQAQQVLIQNRG